MPPPMLSSMCVACWSPAHHGDGRVADDVLEEELRPGLGVELRGPLGKGRPPARRNSRVRPNGANASTPIFRSWASGRIVSSASRLSMGVVDADEVDRLVPHDARAGRTDLGRGGDAEKRTRPWCFGLLDDGKLRGQVAHVVTCMRSIFG